MVRTCAILIAFFTLSAFSASAQTIVDENDPSCLYMGTIVGLDPQGDNFLSVRRRPYGPAGLAEEADRLFTRDRVCIASVSGHWLNVKYMRLGRMYSGWVFDRYVALSSRQTYANSPQPSDDGYFDFASPSKNILCAYSPPRPDMPASVFCQIMQFTSTLPGYSDPDGIMDRCDYPNSFQVQDNAAKANYYCDGPMGFSNRTVILNYGSVFLRGNLSCRSEVSGMTCTNRAGHGFSIAKARQSVF